MAKNKDQELMRRYRDLTTEQDSSSKNNEKLNKEGVEILLHGSDEDILLLVKEHNRRTGLLDSTEACSRNADMVCDNFLKRFAHKKRLYRYEDDGKVYYGPKCIKEDEKAKEEYSIPSGAEFNREHYTECNKRMKDHDTIFDTAWNNEFEIVCQRTFEHEGIPHTEYIMYNPLYNAAIHLEFDVAEEPASGYSIDNLIAVVPYLRPGHNTPIVATLALTKNLANQLGKISGENTITETYPAVVGQFPYFANISEKAAIERGKFSDEEANRLLSLIGISKLTDCDESIQLGFGKENLRAAMRVQDIAKSLIKTA